MDINMTEVDMDQYKDAIEGPKVYEIAARGWTAAKVKENHKDYVITELTAHPDECVAAVIVTSDFLDRARAVDAIKAILIARNVADSDKVEIYPAMPKKAAATGVNSMAIMPFTQIITNCTAAFKLAIGADPVFHGVHEGIPTTFYCIPALPPMPFIFAAYTGFTAGATDVEVKAALFTTLIGRPDFLQMVAEDHSNISGDHKPELVLAIAIRAGTISKCTVRRGGRHGISLTAHRVMIAPISKDHDMNQRLQSYIMAPSFVVDARQHGEGRPWFTGPVTSRTFMSCSECHGIDHYFEICPIINSRGYREAHGITEVDMEASSVPTSLLAPHEHEAASNQWSTVTYRGASRGRGRGGPRGRGGYNNGNGEYNNGYDGGYNGGGRGRGGGGNTGHGYAYKPYSY
ncbi:hypothetical protein DFH07DRAFT_946757 [Mycena maculata]|uniref:Uncharacterized protein n=1 Tax=Mycena maculata TaxID=230809 RepID=A0AAD7MKV6_9AGAR|nr:hypothetical protein DFH07DRAFT_946757 [Mycena maculata]